jgi:hypothetical protein
VRFRNIWIRENIKPLVGLSPDPRPNSVETKLPKNLDDAIPKNDK